MRRALSVLLVVAALVAGCGEEKQAATPSSPAPRSPAAADPETDTEGDPGADSGASKGAGTGVPGVAARPNRDPAGTVITTAGSEFGRMLFDGTGQAIYLFDKEDTDRPACYGPCARAWPPVLTKGRPSPSGAASSKLLGTTRRTDGSTQVTYAGHPLYFYAHEEKNQVLCHNVSEFGGLWLVVTPRGEPAP